MVSLPGAHPALIGSSMISGMISVSIVVIPNPPNKAARDNGGMQSLAGSKFYSRRVSAAALGTQTAPRNCRPSQRVIAFGPYAARAEAMSSGIRSITFPGFRPGALTSIELCANVASQTQCQDRVP